MSVLTFCLADSSYYCLSSFSPCDIFLSPDERAPNGSTTFRIPPGSPSIHEIYRLYPQLPKKPDYIFLKTDALARNFIRQLSDLDVPVIASLADTHHLHRPLETLLSYVKNEKFNLISVENDRHHMKWYSRFGINNLCWLPNLALNPFKYRPKPMEELFPKVCFVGSLGKFHPYRGHAVKNLVDSFPGLIDVFTASRYDASRAYNSYQISLNVSLNSDLNWRFFEILAAGGFLLTDRLPSESGINLFLREGVHYEAFSSFEELNDKVRFYLANPLSAHRIAIAGNEIYWENLSPKHLRKEMIRRVLDFPRNSMFDCPKCSPLVVGNLNQTHLLRIYQICQEIHRTFLRPIIFFPSSFKACFAKELVDDFPRLRCVYDFHDFNNNISESDIALYVGETHQLSSSQFFKEHLPVPEMFIPIDFLENNSYGSELAQRFSLSGRVFRFDANLDCFSVS